MSSAGHHSMMGGGKRPPTARDYVQTGLIANFDGLENGGYGIHVANAVPVDLTGNHTMGTSGNTVTYGDDYFASSTTDYFMFTAADFASALVAKTFSLELVIENSRVANGGIFGLGNRGIWIYSNGSYNISTLNILTSTWTVAVNPNVVSDAAYSFGVYGGSTPTYRYNGTEANATYGSLTTSDTLVMLGAMNYGLKSAVKFHAVRLYNRQLAAAEIAANYAIDAQRFGLT